MSPNIIPDLIPIPAGSFWMGSNLDDSDAEDNEKPLHKVDLPAFNISKYPITNAQYATYIHHSKNHDAPQHWNGLNPPENILDHPVVNISLIEASSYCDWLSQRIGTKVSLPSEIQWEKAARGTANTNRYVWGNNWQPNYCNTLETGIGQTTAVTHFEDTNRSSFGVADMLGNVWEWTESYYQPFPDSPHDSTHYGTSHYVIRGGSWHNEHRLARISCRGRYLPGIKRPYLGFRIVSSIDNPTLINTTELRHKIKDNFTLEEIQVLCYDLGFAPDEFISNSKEDFILKLIVHCQHRELLQALIKLLNQERPNISWH
ncbi:MAG: SUMF1/EgtB/PvdO family nonheme iron enzyme [Anaerolineae bacterium]|nr:SUMF1/EgtB/PvdO family nonheme iron enzyme [Anaerolineae bacterium]